MARKLLTEEEKKARKSEYNRRWREKKKAEDPTFLKRNAERQRESYHFRMQNEEGFREKKRERNRRRHENRTPEQIERDREQKRQYKRDCRAACKRMGIPYLSDEEKAKKAAWQRVRNRERYANDPAYRKYVLKKQKQYYRKRKERLEEEGFQRRLALSQQAREILNY